MGTAKIPLSTLHESRLHELMHEEVAVLYDDDLEHDATMFLELSQALLVKFYSSEIRSSCGA